MAAIYAEPVRVCLCSGLQRTPCDRCGYYVGIENARAYTLNEAVDAPRKVTLVARKKKKRGKGC
jgi:hypothetical protein